MGRPFLRPPLRPLLRPVQHPLLLALSRALLLAALWGAASAGALNPAAQAPGAAASANGAATAPPPDITELQAQLAKLATTADTDEDARALVAQVEAISAGANRLISARTSQLNDLNARLTELVWRYRARNFPQTLNATEQQRWEQHRAACLIEGAGGARTAEQMFAMIDALSETADERAEEILGELYDYADGIVPEV